jgi:hypothetical protein
VVKLTDSHLGIFLRVKLNDATSSRSSIRLVLNLCTLNLANGGEEFDQVFVAG